MFESVECVVLGDVESARGSIVRYELLDRMRRITQKQGVRLLAFGLGDDRFRWLFSGEASAITEVLRGFKVGTCRRSQGAFSLSSWERTVVSFDGIRPKIAWVHDAPWSYSAASDGLNPWTSEVDRLGYRQAAFFDPIPLRALVGGEQMLQGDVRTVALKDSYSLRFLMRLAAAVVGRLAGHPKSFRLFVQLARFFRMGLRGHRVSAEP